MTQTPLHPVILISTATRPRLEGLVRQDVVGGLNYAQAVAALGGVSVFAPNLEPELADAFVASASGLILSGGADADPARFGQLPHPDLGHVDEGRDAFELALYHAARARGVPVLGICRGIQMLNVAEGGTLHQHLPAVPGTMQHAQRNIDGTLFHEVALEPGSLLATTFGTCALRVNSYHHQAVDEVGRNLRVTGRAPDGVIEAVEGTGAGFVLGVQWHPEMSVVRYPEQIAPFRTFMDAVREFMEPARLAERV